MLGRMCESGQCADSSFMEGVASATVQLYTDVVIANGERISVAVVTVTLKKYATCLLL